MKKASLLKNLPRSGWLQSGIGLSKVEDLADHSFEVALAASIMADFLTSKGYNIDREKVLKGALVHDLPECLTTDMPKPSKGFYDEGAVKKAEEKAMKDLIKELPAKIREEYKDAWESHHDGTTEADIIKAADNYVMVLQAKAYKRAGHTNENLERILKSGREGVKKAIEEFPELKALLA